MFAGDKMVKRSYLKRVIEPNMALQRIGYRSVFPDVIGSLRSAGLTPSGPIAELGR